MPFDLSSLPAPPTTTIILRGVDVTVRALPYVALRTLSKSYPAPEPPLGKDPAKGSLSPLVPQLEDPEYKKAFGRWASEVGLIELAAAMDLRVNVPDEPGNDPYSPGWARAALLAMQKTLAEEEISAIRKAYESLFAAVPEQVKN